MYLKSLEITGFKSFPDKTLIEFGKGITGIVGPNGSGKSNISDAIRWVLGEQSTKTLRGGKMEDVIFAGTPMRKGASFAEVALTIDNSEHFLKIDYDEVIIARRYYRSGESDYFINKKIVRLKDVNELLMDTGLGRDGYSMIGQGRIDEVLSVKSGERRDMFEEAAGISKFKYRKEESERKLAATDDNLVRINDIISEVEARYAPLEKKAEKAKNYLIYRDELRGMEIGLWVDDLREARIRSEKAEKDYNLASFSLEEARIASEKAYESSEKTAEAMKEVEIEEENKRGDIRLLEEQRAGTASDLSALETAIRMTGENVERTRRDIAEAESRRDQIEKTILEQEEKLRSLEKEKESNAGRSAALYERLHELTASADAKDARVALLESEAMEAHRDETAHNTSLDAIRNELASLEERTAQIATYTARVHEAYATQKSAVEAGQKEINEAKTRLPELQNLASAFRLRYQSRKGRADEMKARLDKAMSD
ncbi:MAG: AAA family ATPase, partial [Clostridia bacterium]|nr:AAA family ATPase [Clostridia bacterium]